MKIGILLSTVLMILITGCTPKASRSAQTAAPDGTLTNQAAWNWDSYPVVRKMRLGTMPCTLQPRSQITINSTLAGSLKVYVEQPQTNLNAGVVWGEFEPSMFDQEAKALEEARAKIDDREKMLTELELPKKRLQLEREVEEMQRQVSMIRLLSTNVEFATLTLRAGENSSTLRPDSLAKAEAELRLMNQSLTYLRETNMAALGVDLQGMRSDWERRKFEFERRKSQATLKMPFAGQLTVSLPLAEGVAEYPVNMGQELAVARDLSLIRLRVPMGSSPWASLSPERMSALIRFPTGYEFEGAFAYQKVERFQNREEVTYYFQFVPEHAHLIARMIGTDLTCEVFYNTGQPTHIVPKLALIMHNAAAFGSGNWKEGLATLFPGARVAVEGQTDIGVVFPDRRGTNQASR